MRFLLGVLLVATTACGGPSIAGRPLGAAPKAVSFPHVRKEGAIQLQAWFRDTHVQIMRADLIQTKRVLPVYLRVSIDGGADVETKEISQEHLNMTLYLQDGTAVPALRTTTLLESGGLSQESRKNISREQLPSSFLEPGDEAKGFVFFQLPPRNEVLVRGGRIDRVSGPYVRTLDLYRSVIALELTDGDKRTVYLGIDRR